jgi:hypothetical protein
MGRLFTAEECLRHAAECLAAAQTTPDEAMRGQFLKMAETLTKLAARLEEEAKVMDICDAPSAEPGKKPRHTDSDATQ